MQIADAKMDRALGIADAGGPGRRVALLEAAAEAALVFVQAGVAFIHVIGADLPTAEAD